METPTQRRLRLLQRQQGGDGNNDSPPVHVNGVPEHTGRAKAISTAAAKRQRAARVRRLVAKRERRRRRIAKAKEEAKRAAEAIRQRREEKRKRNFKKRGGKKQSRSYSNNSLPGEACEEEEDDVNPSWYGWVFHQDPKIGWTREVLPGSTSDASSLLSRAGSVGELADGEEETDEPVSPSYAEQSKGSDFMSQKLRQYAAQVRSVKKPESEEGHRLQKRRRAAYVAAYVKRVEQRRKRREKRRIKRAMRRQRRLMNSRSDVEPGADIGLPTVLLLPQRGRSLARGSSARRSGSQPPPSRRALATWRRRAAFVGFENARVDSNAALDMPDLDEDEFEDDDEDGDSSMDANSRVSAHGMVGDSSRPPVPMKRSVSDRALLDQGDEPDLGHRGHKRSRSAGSIYDAGTGLYMGGVEFDESDEDEDDEDVEEVDNVVLVA